MSLYRKYRPQNFENLVGQDHVSITLNNALKLSRVSHAYLFTGPRGTGKTTSARIMAKAVNCLNLKDGTPCEECEICRDINDGRLIDVIEIDAASNRGIDEMRDLKEKINFAPTRARNKVYIIDEVHMLTKEAFNALLKTLEEPPESVYFILATTEVHKVPETILSRCQRFDFKRINVATLVGRLKHIAGMEGIEAENKALEMIADHAQGGMRDAIGLMEQMSVSGKLTFDHVCTILGVSGYASIEKLFGFLEQGDAVSALDEIHSLYSEGFDLINFNKNFLEYLRRKLLESVEKNENGKVVRLLKWIDLFQESYEKSRYTPIAQLPLEVAAIVASGLMGSGLEVLSAKTVTNEIPSERKATSQDKTVQVTAAENTERKHGGINATADRKVVERAEEAGSGNSMDVDFTLDDVKSKWKEILTAVKLPAARQALTQALPGAVNNHDITLQFSNNFFMEKINEPHNRVEIENAFNSILKSNVRVRAELRATGRVPENGSSTASTGGDSVTDNVLEILGGGMVA